MLDGAQRNALGTTVLDQRDIAEDAATIFKRQFSDPTKSLSTVGIAMDQSIQEVKRFASTTGLIPAQTLSWYSQYGFIGWQICAILSQQWLIDKAIRMPGMDAVRHGFKRTTDDDNAADPDAIKKLVKLDKKFHLKKNLHEHIRFARMFGIRHTLFLYDNVDYALPFNPDGIKKGAYRGMVQIDPYWLAPELDMEDSANPMSQHFYEPTYWNINGRRYHRSHFVISRNGADLPDILKPAYYYGGIPTTQLIYERVYAAERVANEAPMLAMSKRLFALRTDLTKAAGNLAQFKAKIRQWSDFMQNFGIKVIGQGEEIQLHDTSLAELENVIRNQYELVAAAAHVPASKLLGTSPTGGIGNAGDYEIQSYHEFLETIQDEALSPLIERHTTCCQRSEGIATAVEFNVEWNPLDVLGEKEQAEVDKMKADTANVYSQIGAINGMDVRTKLINDPTSGYNDLEELDLPDLEEELDKQDEMQEQVAEGAGKPVEDSASGWITVNGAHVKLNKNGVPVDGPPGLINKLSESEKTTAHENVKKRSDKNGQIDTSHFKGENMEERVPWNAPDIDDDESFSEVREVNIEELSASQSHVDAEGVEAYASGTGYEGRQLPSVYEHKGRKIIMEGHHRLSALALSGRKTALVKYAKAKE